jgi:hypothetical protein
MIFEEIHEEALSESQHWRVHHGERTGAISELFHDTLKDIFFAEKKILGTLPKMAKMAQSPDLKAAFEIHRRETEGHVTRLEKVFAAIEKRSAHSAQASKDARPIDFGLYSKSKSLR